MQKIESIKWRDIVAVPDLVTFLGLLCGIFALYFNSKQRLDVAFALVLLSAILDLGDGIVARLLSKNRSFGGYFDCMVDTITFLAVIPILTYQLGLTNLIYPIFFVTCGALRHARLLAYPHLKLLGFSSTVSGFAFPLLYFLNKIFSFDLIFVFKILMILLSLGMVSQLNTRYRPLFSSKA